MTYLDVGENELNIESLGGLSALRELVMPCNCMQSAVIGKGQFQSLQHLDLSFNSVAASSLATFEHLISLETLNLSNNGLAQVPLELSTLPCLSNLDLSSNLFATDDVLITLSSASALKTLNLSRNQMRSFPPLASKLGRFLSLKVFDLSHNQVSQWHSIESVSH